MTKLISKIQTVSYQNGGKQLSQEDKKRLWDFHEKFGADRSKEHYFNFWNFQKGDQGVSDEQIMFQINNVAYKNNNNFLNHV